MARMYRDGTYLDNNPTWHEEDSTWKAKQIKKIIESNALIPNKICEVGCGAGRFTEIMLEAGAEIVSIDLSDAVEANYQTNKKRQVLFALQRATH